MTEAAPLLELSGIDKSFGAVRANRSVSLTLHRGEVVGLLGENGAGKTTLMNVLFGIYSADAGVIRIDGRPAAIHGPADALAVARDPGDAQDLAAMHGEREVLERDRPARRGFGAQALERE